MKGNRTINKNNMNNTPEKSNICDIFAQPFN